MTSSHFLPVPMAAVSVRGIELDIKTQTRRVLEWKNASSKFQHRRCFGEDGFDVMRKNCRVRVPWRDNEQIQSHIRAPYSVGDILWVRESWRPLEDGNGAYIEFGAGGTWQPEEELWQGEIGAILEYDKNDRLVTRWRSPRFMYRWIARHWLEVTQVRLQHLQEISEEDAIAEGVGLEIDGREGMNARAHFAKHWDAINAHRGYGWSKNPRVWAITFRRVDRPSTGVLFEMMERGMRKAIA